MDWMNPKERLVGVIGKYKYVVLIILLGMVFMWIPEKGDAVPISTESHDEVRQDISKELEEILGQIQGVGRVSVMITLATGEETVYQTDMDRSEGNDSFSEREDTVIVSGNGVQSGLVQTVTPPTYLGAIIVCQGADRPTVQLAVMQAVSAVTGIGTDRITVLKMK